MESQLKTEQETPNIHSECVKEEFYKWFEKRGLLSELRAYMRQLMVKALQESNANSNTGVQQKAATSPKLQAINLLLVDYLFHEDYLYTLSVFASEAHILESLPQYSRYVTETVRQHRRDPSCLPRFSRQEIEDILDTLRLLPSRHDMEQAIRLYLSHQESLFMCVARTLASHHTSPINSPHSEWDEVAQESGGHQLWSKEMQNLLLMAGVKLQHIQRMQLKWQYIIEEEKRKTREDCEKDQLIQQAEWEERVRTEIEEGYSEERNNLEERKRELNELASQLGEVHGDISQRFAQIQEQSKELQEREKELQEKEEQQRIERELLQHKLNNIQERERCLESSTHRSEDTNRQPEESDCLQKDHVDTFDASVQVSESAPVPGPQVPGPQVRSAAVLGHQVNSTHTQTANTVDHQQQTSASLEPDPHLLLQLKMEREKVNELQEETLELRAHALQQRRRIDELTNQAASLSNQLEESQIALTLLNGQRNDSLAPVPLPTPALPPTQGTFVAPTFGFNSLQRQGAGEESLFTPRPQQAVPRPDGRRRPSRFVFSNNPNPTSEESSPTDEVVQNARARIQELEAESVAVQRSYQAFQSRLLNSDSVMFPPLGARIRIADPLLRSRRPDIMSFFPFSSSQSPFHNINYRQQTRPVQSPEEDDDEDSSSDQPTMHRLDRIESIAHSRRLFTERSIRHFERWKQFKKKYQRRSETLQNTNRRYHTSSDDDSDNIRNHASRHELNRVENTEKDNALESQELSKSNVFTFKRNRNKFKDHPKFSMKKPQTEEKEMPCLNKIAEESYSTDKPVAHLENKHDENKLKLEIEQSMKLVKSVKTLLEAQNLTNPAAPETVSYESLAVESVPRDSDEQSQNEIALTENTSALTVKVIYPVEEITEEKNNEHRNEIRATDNMYQLEESGQDRAAANTSPQNNSDVKLSEERIDDAELEPSPLPLNIPNLRLVSSPGCNVASEDQITSTGVGEQESGEVTSITSASDILRELNPSKDSSDSPVSVGINSNSEDFWN